MNTHLELDRIFNLFTNEEELMHQLGCKRPCYLPSVILKELLDNAIDSDASKLEIEIKKEDHECLISVKDNGYGILSETLKALHPNKFVSSKRLSRRPERGKKGNALITIIALLSKQNRDITFINSDGLHKIKFIPIYDSEKFQVSYTINKDITNQEGTTTTFISELDNELGEIDPIDAIFRCLLSFIIFVLLVLYIVLIPSFTSRCNI